MSALGKWCLRHRTEILIAVGTFFACVVLYSLTALKYPNDDQFILYRYIDHIATGQGFVYNIGEKVLGSTTPLFTLLAAGFKFAFPFVPTPVLVAYINMALLSGASVFFYLLARRFVSFPAALLAVAVFSLNLTRTIPEGMETPLFLLAALGCAHFLFAGRQYAASIFLALAVLTRPDAGLIAVLAFIWWWRSKGFANALRYAVAAGTVLLPWLVFATLYFGSFVPQSLATKLHSDVIYHLPSLQGAKVQAAALSRMYWGRFFDPDNLPLQTAFNLLPVLIFAALGSWRMLRKDFNAWILVAIPLVYFVSFALSNPIIFPWYLSEMEPFWILLTIAGAAFLFEKIKHPLFVGLCAAALISGPLYYWATTTVTKDEGSKMTAFELASYIRAHEAPGDTVGLADIGIVGYVTGARIVDFIGLVRNESLAYYPVTDACADPDALYTVPPDLIKDSRPTWLVAGRSQLAPCFLESDWFAAHYEEAYAVGAASVWRLR